MSYFQRFTENRVRLRNFVYCECVKVNSLTSKPRQQCLAARRDHKSHVLAGAIAQFTYLQHQDLWRSITANLPSLLLPPRPTVLLDLPPELDITRQLSTYSYLIFPAAAQHGDGRKRH